MSHQIISSNLVVDLTTAQQELLTGGYHRLCEWEDRRDDDKKDDDKKYNILIDRPFIFRPNYFVKA